MNSMQRLNPNVKLIGALLLLLLVTYCTVFYNLGANQMHMWDESSYALTAYDMLQRGEWIETYFLGEPDLYNTKPPFVIWCMAASIKVGGFTEYAVRFPSALAALGTALVLFTLGFHQFKNPWYALIAPLILVTAPGYLGEHIATTGDTDAILAFWITLYCACFYVASQHQTQFSKYVFAGCVALTFACLTKGGAGLLALPGVAAWLVWSRLVKRTFTDIGFILGFVFWVTVIGGYYLYRNHVTPNYLATVWHYEVMGRVAKQDFLDPNAKPFWYYLAEFAKWRFVPWAWLLIIVLGCYLLMPNLKTPKLLKASACFLLSITILLGLSATKPFWYDAPMYPWFAAFLGWLITCMAQNNSVVNKVAYWIITPSVLVMTVVRLQQPIETNLKTTWQKAFEQMPKTDTLYIANIDFDFRLQFYGQQYLLSGMRSKIVLPNDSALQAGSWVLCAKQARSNDLLALYTADTIFTDNGCYLYRLKELKNK